jgi:hypothetical protein
VPKKEGWADAKKYLPQHYDLCQLKLTNEKYVSGWWTGTSWDGLRFNELDSDKVIAWKRIRED